MICNTASAIIVSIFQLSEVALNTIAGSTVTAMTVPSPCGSRSARLVFHTAVYQGPALPTGVSHHTRRAGAQRAVHYGAAVWSPGDTETIRSAESESR